jgi:hypothetical protein
MAQVLLTSYFLHSPTSSPRLRVGVLLDDDQLAKPFARVLECIQQSNFADLVVRIYNASAVAEAVRAAATPPSSVFQRMTRILRDPKRRQHLLWAFYDKLDARFAFADRGILGSVDVSALLKEVPRIDVEPIAKGFTHRFPAEAVEAIRRHNIDVLLRFGFNIIRGDILQVARYGMWSYHHGDNDYYRGGPAHLWELIESNPFSGVLLQILNEELDGGRVLCKGLAPTESTLLLSKNRVQPYLLGSTFVMRKLFELHRSGFPELEAKTVVSAPYAGKQKIYRAPTNWQLARFLLPPLIQKVVGKPFRRKRVGHWRLAFRVGRPMHLERGKEPDLTGFCWFESPRGRFYADPFLFAKDQRNYCFFEDFDYAANRGRISCGEVMPDGGMTDVRPVLTHDYHLSYPFLFEDAGEIHMIPESSENNSVDLYRAVSFPHRWDKVASLLDAPGLDTTIIQRGDYYWLFTSVSEPPGAAAQLVLMYARQLAGPYQFHTHTPITADARHARCGGRIFEQDGWLFRPSQDASGTYDSTLHFQRIVELTRDFYREEPFTKLRPPRGFMGLHTYDRCGTVETIDGKQMQLMSRHLIKTDPVR